MDEVEILFYVSDPTQLSSNSNDMTADYSTIDAVLKKSDLFWNMCEDLASSIYVEYDQQQVNDDVLDQFFDTQYDDSISDTKWIEAEDYINSYGIFKAMESYLHDYGNHPTTPLQLLYHIAYQPTKLRFNGIIQNAK